MFMISILKNSLLFGDVQKTGLYLVYLGFIFGLHYVYIMFILGLHYVYIGFT